jgi:hypothetical protein
MISKNQKIYLAAAVVILIALGAGAALYYKNNKGGPADSLDTTGLTQEQIQENKQILDNPLKETETYRNPDPLYSFQYPKGMNVGSFDEGEDGHTVLLQRPGAKLGFQIYTSSFDEDITLTADRIKNDLPDTKVEQPETWNVGGLQAVAFISENASFGKTREVWFVYNKNLYQITAYAELSNFLKQILSTWKFQG